MPYYFNNQFLVAMPTIVDSGFSRSVGYLCQHNEEGALAVVINRPMNMTLNDILEQMEIHTSSQQVKDKIVFAGGPVQHERGFIVHSKDSRTWESSISISSTTSITSSRDILEAIADNNEPENYLVALGYAGWGAGQLESEMTNNDWLNTPYEESILYEIPVEQRWIMAANQLGIDINRLTIPAGHA